MTALPFLTGFLLCCLSRPSWSSPASLWSPLPSLVWVTVSQHDAGRKKKNWKIMTAEWWRKQIHERQIHNHTHTHTHMWGNGGGGEWGGGGGAIIKTKNPDWPREGTWSWALIRQLNNPLLHISTATFRTLPLWLCATQLLKQQLAKYKVVSHRRGPHLLDIVVLVVTDGLFSLCRSKRLDDLFISYPTPPNALFLPLISLMVSMDVKHYERRQTWGSVPATSAGMSLVV